MTTPILMLTAMGETHNKILGFDAGAEPLYCSRQTADVRGYGVGLSLVARIIWLHAGEISVRSQAGEPTIFSLALPRFTVN